MARVKEFEPKQALDKAMQLFWQKGYFDTSMDDLVAFTGVSRYGLYGTFGGKHELFIAALEHYRKEILSWLLIPVDFPNASLADIRSYFDSLVKLRKAPGGRKGCLICNTAIELAPFDKEAADQVSISFERMTKVFRNALNNALQQGELSSRFDVDAGADYLTGVAQGLFVLIKAPSSETALKHFIQFALDGLK